MAGIQEMIDRMQRVNITEAVELAVDETAADLLRLQKEQMLDGKDAKGGQIGKYRSKKYAAMKNAMNPRPGFGNMDFKLTGDFHRGLFADARTHSVVIDSSDEKTERLLRINKDIFGLSAEPKNQYVQEHLSPAATGIIKKQITG